MNELLTTIHEQVPGDSPEPTYADPRVGDIRSSHASIDAAKAALGYAPEVTFAEVVAATITWLSANPS